MFKVKRIQMSDSNRTIDPFGNKRDNTAFLEYFKSFYGIDGLYPNDIPRYTKNQVLAGIICRGGNFDGDSIDRELIKMMIWKLKRKK